MPKVTWVGAAARDKPKVKYLAAVFRAYRKAAGMTSKDVAEAVGCSASNARVQMNKPGAEWNIGQLTAYCDALHIPYSEAAEAAMRG